MVNYIDFVENRLELGVDYGAVGGFQFKTSIIQKGDGSEQRNSSWWLPLGRWQLGERNLLESDRKAYQEVSYLKDFHSSRQGSKQGFRFKDWSDYKVINQELGITDGIIDKWQLRKTYFAGDSSAHRPIVKPVEGTLLVYLDGETIDYHSIDHQTGLLSFPAPPMAGKIITVDFEFDVPVCFEQDAISWDLLGYHENEKIYKLGSLFVKEIRLPLPLPWQLNPPEKISSALDLGIILDTSEKIEFSTQKNVLASGYTRKDSNWNNPRTTINLPRRNWDDREIEKILGYFWNSKGRLQLFNLFINGQSYLCRFNRDQLNIRFEARQNDTSLFSIAGLDFLNLTNLNYQILLPSLPLIYQAGSIVNLAGLALSEFDAVGVANLDLKIQFDFGVTENIEITTDENGFFFVALQVKPNLTHPDNGKFILSNGQTDFIYYDLDINTSPESIPFSLNVLSEVFAGNTINLDGVAPAGTIINLKSEQKTGFTTVESLSLVDTNITVDAAGNWSYAIPTSETQETTTIQITLTHPDFDPIIRDCTIRKLIFNPVLGIENFQYN